MSDRLQQVERDIQLLQEEKERLLQEQEAKKTVNVGPFIDLKCKGDCGGLKNGNCEIYWRYSCSDMHMNINEVRAMGKKMIEFADNLS